MDQRCVFDDAVSNATGIAAGMDVIEYALAIRVHIPIHTRSKVIHVAATHIAIEQV